MELREIISGATNADEQYDDVYLPKKAGIPGSPASDRALDGLSGAVIVLAAGALALRLWRTKGPGRRKLRRERESD